MKLLAEIAASLRPLEAIEIHPILKKIQIPDTKVIIGGSRAKGTWLKDSAEIDVFVAFDKKRYGKTDISAILKKELDKNFNVEQIHGSRDYYQMQYKGLTIEIIPIIDIKKAEHALNITDISPLHCEWVGKHTNDSLCDEIRLAKQFCKALKIYGAESHINGFSGYGLEILTIYYGSFLKFLKAASKWTEQVVIDPEKYYKTKQDVIFNINKSKRAGPLIVVDPVDKTRNVAAAVNRKSFGIIVSASKKFLDAPSSEHFEVKTITEQDIVKEHPDAVIIKVIPLKNKPDVAGSKQIKAFNYIKKALKHHEFVARFSGWEWDNANDAYFWFVFENNALEDLQKRIGPPEKLKTAAKGFKKKYKEINIENGRLVASIKRKYKDPRTLIKNLFKEDYVKERAERYELL